MPLEKRAAVKSAELRFSCYSFLSSRHPFMKRPEPDWMDEPTSSSSTSASAAAAAARVEAKRWKMKRKGIWSSHLRCFLAIVSLALGERENIAIPRLQSGNITHAHHKKTITPPPPPHHVFHSRSRTNTSSSSPTFNYTHSHTHSLSPFPFPQERTHSFFHFQSHAPTSTQQFTEKHRHTERSLLGVIHLR